MAKLVVSRMDGDLAQLPRRVESETPRRSSMTTRLLMRSVDDREECDGTEWSRSLGKTKRKLQQKKTGNFNQGAT